MQMEYEQRLGVVLADLRDLRNRELKRLEAEYQKLYADLLGENSKAESDLRVKAAIAKIERTRLDFNDNVDQLKASKKRLQAMGFPGIPARPAPATKPGSLLLPDSVELTRLNHKRLFIRILVRRCA